MESSMRLLILFGAFVSGLLILTGCGGGGVPEARETGDVQSLVVALETGDAAARDEAARALGELGDAARPAVPTLIDTLEDEDPWVQVTAATALGQIADARAVEPLVAALERPCDPSCYGDNAPAQLRGAAIQALGGIGSPAAVKALARFGEDFEYSDYGVSDALAAVGKPAVKPLIAVLRRNGDNTTAATALGEIGDTRAIPVLIRTWANPATTDALVAIGKPAVEPLMAAARQGEDPIRKHAITALGEIGDRRAAPLLTELVAEAEPGVWQTASTALALVERDHVKELLALLSSPETVRVHLGLIELGRKGTEDELVAALESYGFAEMAEDFLESGNTALERAAKDWAKTHGYEITILIPGTGTWGTLEP
jgi:hypothetical protein